MAEIRFNGCERKPYYRIDYTIHSNYVPLQGDVIDLPGCAFYDVDKKMKYRESLISLGEKVIVLERLLKCTCYDWDYIKNEKIKDPEHNHYWLLKCKILKKIVYNKKKIK